jgi:predicted sugar kinase
VGVHGFDRGGLLIEMGKFSREGISPLIENMKLPERWRVVLFTTASSAHWHGAQERRAFVSAQTGNRDKLQQIAATAIIPSAKSGDLEAFGGAVHEFNRLAGEPFDVAQGGSYSSPAIAELIAELRELGIRGVGQSSWGPTVFAIVGDSDAALSLALRYRSKMPVVVARVSGGHRMEQH